MEDWKVKGWKVGSMSTGLGAADRLSALPVHVDEDVAVPGRAGIIETHDPARSPGRVLNGRPVESLPVVIGLALAHLHFPAGHNRG